MSEIQGSAKPGLINSLLEVTVQNCSVNWYVHLFCRWTKKIFREESIFKRYQINTILLQPCMRKRKIQYTFPVGFIVMKFTHSEQIFGIL